jgi:hypothetical protein
MSNFENMNCGKMKAETNTEAVNKGWEWVFEASKIISFNTGGPHYGLAEIYKNRRVIGEKF